MKKFALLVLPLALICSCSSDNTTTEKNPNPEPKIQALEEKDLYNFEIVESFMNNAPDSTQEESKKVFLNAIDLYRNKKNPEQAIAEFRKSLFIFPDAKTYYEMGNALLDTKNYAEAIQSYHMAEQMDFNPLANVLYNLACAYSMSENGSEALKYIQLSIENGYGNKKHMLTDNDLAFARNQPEFTKVYEAAMSGASSPEAAMFDLYVSGFQQSTFPIVMTAVQTQKVRFKNSIAYDFESFISEMVNPNFSREVGDEFYYLALLKETENYTALIYAGKQVMYEQPPIYHILATYSKDGKLIDKLELGGYHYYDDPMRAYKITEDLKIEMNEFEVVFEKNVDEFGYENNPISANQLLTSRKFEIASNGKIKQTDGDPIAWVSWIKTSIANRI